MSLMLHEEMFRAKAIQIKANLSGKETSFVKENEWKDKLRGSEREKELFLGIER